MLAGAARVYQSPCFGRQTAMADPAIEVQDRDCPTPCRRMTAPGDTRRRLVVPQPGDGTSAPMRPLATEDGAEQSAPSTPRPCSSTATPDQGDGHARRAHPPDDGPRQD